MTGKTTCAACGQRIEFDLGDFGPGDTYACPTCEADIVPVPERPGQEGGVSCGQYEPAPSAEDVDVEGWDLVEQCRRMGADGVLTGEEVWTLAGWLNAHPEATKKWPGRELAQVLQRVFRGGLVDEGALGLLGEVLVGIERRASELAPAIRLMRQADAASAANGDVTEEEMRRIEVPSFRYRAEVASAIGVAEYRVDLESQVCSCPDWQERRGGLAQGDPGRFCRHMVQALVAGGFLDQVDAATGAVMLECLSRSSGTEPGQEYSRLCAAQGDVAVYGGGGGWLQVLTQREGGWDRFGYHETEHRWSFGQPPAGVAAAIRRWVERRAGSG